MIVHSLAFGTFIVRITGDAEAIKRGGEGRTRNLFTRGEMERLLGWTRNFKSDARQTPQNVSLSASPPSFEPTFGRNS